MRHSASAQEQFESYWTTESGWSTELQLRNNLVEEDLTVTPAVRFADGSELTLSAVTIKPATVASVDLSAQLANTSTLLPSKYGSVVLRYSARSFRNLYAAAMVHEHGHPIAFHVDASGSSEESQAGSREGIWWLPNATAEGRLIVTNQSSEPTQVRVVLRDAGGKPWSMPLILAGRTVQRISLRDVVNRAGHSGSAGTFSVEADKSGRIDTVAFLYDELAGFSALLKTFRKNPLTRREERAWNAPGSWVLRAPMLPMSQPDSALAIPAGITLNPLLFVANTTDRQINAKMRLTWTADSGDQSADVAVVQLGPRETRTIRIRDLQDQGPVPKDVPWTTVALSADCMPNDLVAVAASYDKSLRYGAQTPFNDQLNIHMEGGSWEVDATHNSMFTVGNGSARTVKAQTTIFYDGGQKKYQLVSELKPEQRVIVNVGDLIRKRIPDMSGEVLPPALRTGTYQVMEVDAQQNASLGSLFESKVITDKTLGHAAYGCMMCCGYYSGSMNPYPSSLLAPGATGVDVYGENACSGTMDLVTFYYDTWWTGNTSVATAQYGQWNGVSSGSTTGYAFGQLLRGDGYGAPHNGDDPVQCPTTQDTPQEGLQVQVPDHLRVANDVQQTIGCPNLLPSTMARQITYIVEDSNNSPILTIFDVRENVPTNIVSSCSGQTVITGATCVPNLEMIPNQLGRFADRLQTACPSSSSVPTPCGFDFPNQQWQWCPIGGAPTSMGTIGPVSVRNTFINVDGNTSGFALGSTVFPK